MRKDVLDLIKQTGAVRKFNNVPIPDTVIEKIIEAGIWGPAVLAVQPWELTIVNNKEIIVKISEIMIENSCELPEVPMKVAKLTARVIKNSSALILIYNNRKIQEGVDKYGETFIKHALMAEIQAIGATIQNMILVASSLGVGSTWLDFPTFFSKEINDLINNKSELVALVALGYPDQLIIRSKRKIKVCKQFFKNKLV